jgi:hypothetical protein
MIKINEYDIKFIENKDIPFESLILTTEEINLRNDIYKDLFINANFNEDSIMRFIDNIFLFYDMTKYDELSKIIDDVLSLKEINPHSKDILDNLKMKIISFDNVRKNFEHNRFINNFYKKNPMVGMAFREHGQPYKKYKPF